jgi:Xaa-Pro aminopeptidase
MKKSTEARLIVGSSRDSADLLYATGFKVPDPIVFLSVAAQRYLVVPPMELGRAQAECPRFRIFSPDMLKVRTKLRRQPSGWAAGLLRELGVKRVEVPGTFPLGVARKLEQGGVRVALVEGSFFPERAVKTQDEIAKLRAAQRATANAMRTAFAMIADARADARGVLQLGRRTLTAEAVRTAIHHRLLDDRCAGGDTIVAGGATGADPHAAGHGPLRAGEPIVIDIFPQHLETGYWGDMTRTVVKGRPTPRIRAMYRAVRAAQDIALARLRPGAQVARIHAAVEAEFARRGFPRETLNGQPAGFIHGTGHGLGLEVHEAPSLGKTTQVLRAGNVVTVEPGLYYPGVGGVRVEDAVVVTKTGFEYLAPCAKTLLIR